MSDLLHPGPWPSELPIRSRTEDVFGVTWEYRSDGLWHDDTHGQVADPGTVPDAPPTVRADYGDVLLAGAALIGLLVDDPWCYSQAGLDDGCHFCGSETRYTDEAVFIHEPACAWMAAMDAVGRDHPYHQVRKAAR